MQDVGFSDLGLSSTCVWSWAEDLTFSEVCVNAHISSCSSQTLVFPIWNVFLGLWVNVFFCQAKVYDVDGVLPFGAWSPYKEVLRFYVSIDQASGMNELHAGYLRAQRRQNQEIRTKLQFSCTEFFFYSWNLFLLVVWLSWAQSLKRRCGHRDQRDPLGWVPVAPEPLHYISRMVQSKTPGVHPLDEHKTWISCINII